MSLLNIYLVTLAIVHCNAQAGLIEVPLSLEFNQETFCLKKADGDYRHPFDCSHYVSCVANLVAYDRKCASDLLFNPNIGTCDYAKNVECLEQQGEVCYGAKDSAFGTFTMKRSGKLLQLSLEHLSGYQSCDVKIPAARSHWGCGVGFRSVLMASVVTDTKNLLLFPFFKLLPKYPGYYGLARTDAFSRVLTLYNFNKEIKVYEGQTLRIWNGEDLVNVNEENNGGRHCVRVWVSYLERL